MHTYMHACYSGVTSLCTCNVLARSPIDMCEFKANRWEIKRACTIKSLYPRFSTGMLLRFGKSWNLSLYMWKTSTSGYKPTPLWVIHWIELLCLFHTLEAKYELWDLRSLFQILHILTYKDPTKTWLHVGCLGASWCSFYEDDSLPKYGVTYGVLAALISSSQIEILPWQRGVDLRLIYS